MSGRRCGGILNLKALYATIEQADQVACEFQHSERVRFLESALRTEHPTIVAGTDKCVVELWLEGWGKTPEQARA